MVCGNFSFKQLVFSTFNCGYSVQGLKSEPFGKSALAEMLLRRALCNIRVAYVFFWMLRSELGQMGKSKLILHYAADSLFLALILPFFISLLLFNALLTFILVSVSSHLT